MRRAPHIYDDLHGIVNLLPDEMRLVNSPWFQRLRNIRQLGLAHMIFPGAEHTRFAHSIGVFHLAARIAERFQDHLKDTNKEVAARELRAAALLHDIGHFPFSHTLESVYKKAAVRTPEKWAKAKSAGPTLPSASSEAHTDDAAPHEKPSRHIIENTNGDEGITRILRESSPSLDPARVGEIVVAAHEDVLLNQIVKSDLDVDQLDYLLRDAKATGSSYGQYDLGYLIECLEVVYLEGKPVLCVTMQGLHSVEHYVLAKYFYYLCILYQKTRCIAEGILQAVASDLIEKGLIPSRDEVMAKVADGTFCGFDDSFIWARLREAERDEGVASDVRCAIDMLIRRRFPKLVSETHRTLRGSDELPADVRRGPSEAPNWNPVLRHAVELQCHQEFCVLKRVLKPGTTLKEMLGTNPEPIRLLVTEPYAIPKKRPSVAVQDRQGNPAGRLILLQSLQDSVVGKLAGQTTHIARVYRPPSTPVASEEP